MHQLAYSRPHFHCSMVPGLVLLGNWFAGLSLGLLAARFRGDAFASMFLAAPSAELAFSGAVVVTMLPLLLSACAVLIFRRRGAYGVCLLRGLGLGFSLGAAAGACTAGGTLLSGLLLFSGLASAPVLLWYLWRRVSLEARFFTRDTLVSAVILCCIAAVDTLVIAPFLALAVTF